MPIVALLIISASAGALVAFAGLRYPNPVIGQRPTEAAAEQIANGLEERPWLSRLVRERLNPATATGLALTLALGLTILGGVLIGLLAYLVRSSGTLVRTDISVGQWGVDNATSWSTDALRLVTQLGNTRFVIVALIFVAQRRSGRRSRAATPRWPQRSTPPQLSSLRGGDPGGRVRSSRASP